MHIRNCQIDKVAHSLPHLHKKRNIPLVFNSFCNFALITVKSEKYGKILNPFTDVGFKRIFGQAIHKELLIDFLNDLLVGEKRITDITFLDKELLPDFSGDRGCHL